jgi:uncharacterized membrane protein YccC
VSRALIAHLTEGLHRLRAGWLRILEATVAASLAWLIATHLLHHAQPFFAPAAALIVLGVTLGQRLQRAVEILAGVAVGVLLADLITHALGPRTFGALAVVLILTITLAVALGGGPILAVQATVSAVYVAVVPQTGTPGVSRFYDALVGGAVALLINQLPLHRDPVRTLLDEAGAVFDRLAGVLDAVADALAQHDHAAAQAALEDARAIDPEVARFVAAVGIGVESTRFDPMLRRRRQPLLMRYEEVARQIDYAVRNTRVLARNVVAVTRGPVRAPGGLPDAVRELGRAVQALSRELVDEDLAPEVHDHALAAVRGAAGSIAPDMPLPMLGIVWQVRSTAVDLLRGTGLELAQVLEITDALF